MLVVLAGFASVEPARARGTRERVVVLGRGQSWETRAILREGPADGPTVMIVGGVHGNEPAGADAAEQILGWELSRGRLLVLPRANVRALRARKRLTPGVAKADSNLNRNFPRTGGERPRGPLARAIWRLVEKTEPDWLLDLHEGISYHVVNKDSCGHSVIHHPDHDEAVEVARLMVAAANETVTGKGRRFLPLRQGTRSTLARSAGDHLGVHTLILETCYGKGPRSRRARRHRLMVEVLLTRLGMLAEGVGVDTLLPACRESRELRVAVYDAEGTGGLGVSKVLAQVGAEPRTVLRRVCPEDVRGGALEAFDIVTFTGGSGSAQARALGETGRKRVQTFVSEGGGYVGVCAGAYLALAGFSWGLHVIDAKTVSPRWKRGKATLEMTFTAAGRRALRRGRRGVSVLYHNGPVFEPADVEALSDYDVWATYETEVSRNGTPKGVMVGSPAIAAATYGEGRVVVIGPHPEQTKGLEDVVPRAVRWLGGRRTR